MNLYETLGVAKTAAADEIKQAYKKLAKKFHPDTNPNNPGAEAKFKEISAAYSVLNDSQKRANYDRELDGLSNPYGGNPFQGYGGGADPFFSFFEQFQFIQNNNHLNVTHRLILTFLDPKVEHTRSIKFTRKIHCKNCNGTGAKTYGGNCGICAGRGKLRGFSSLQTQCNSCAGTGKQITEYCKLCSKGLLDESVELNVTIPAGIISGKILRVAGEGNRSNQGRGDLLIQIDITNDLRWERQGANILSRAPVSYPTLVMGGAIDVETIWGKEKIQIPPQTRVGQAFQLYGKGFPRLNSITSTERGVHNVIVDLTIPNTKNPEHLELLQKLKKFYDEAG